MTALANKSNTNESAFRIAVMSGAPPRVLAKLLSEICDNDHYKVTGVLYWVPQPKSLSQRVKNFATQLRQPAYLQYVADRLISTGVEKCRSLGRFLWKLMHAHFPQEEYFGVKELAEHCQRLGIPFKTPARFHCEESLNFVGADDPHLGLVYGTPILKPELFDIPEHGSVNLHQRKVPDYRGGGPIALWEMLDQQTEIGVTVHRVATKLDAGAVIRSVTIPIEPTDTLTSMDLKAHVVGIDLLLAVIDDFDSGNVVEQPQQGQGRMFRIPKPEAMPKIQRQLHDLRGNHPVELTYPLWKSLARLAVCGPWIGLRNWYRRLTGTFPVVVLYHHVITERPHFMGMSTDQFVSQMRYLRRYYNVVDLNTGMKLLKSGKVTKPTVVLTLDDGYRDNVLNLRAAALDGKVPATLYISSNHIEQQEHFKHDVDRGYTDFAPMTWQQLRRLESWGFQTGAHTRTHFDCGSTDSELLRREITECRSEIESAVGHDVTDFSFPFGLPHNISAEAFQIATSHYNTVATAYGGVNRCGQEGSNHVYRVPHPASILELELLMQSILMFGQPDYWTGGDDNNSDNARSSKTSAAQQRELVEV